MEESIRDDSVSGLTKRVHRADICLVKTRNTEGAKYRDAKMVQHPQINPSV